MYKPYCLFKYGYPDFFWGVNIEISTYCNRRCHYCPNAKYGTPREYMPEELFKKVILDLRDIGYNRTVSYEFYWEPLLDDRLVEFIRFSRENLLRGAFLRVLSNGDRLTAELFERLVEAGMNEIVITLHDPDPTKMMGKLQPIIERHPSHIRVKSNRDSRYLFSRGGAIEIEGGARIDKCFYSGKAIVDHEGNVLLCCNDYFHPHVFGNVKSEKLEGIWKKKEFTEVRHNARRGIPDLGICKRCLSITEDDRALAP